MQDYDIICIGIGSEDSSMAFTLAQTGREALLFEIVGFVRNKRENWEARKAGTKGIYRPDEKWYGRETF